MVLEAKVYGGDLKIWIYKIAHRVFIRVKGGGSIEQSCVRERILFIKGILAKSKKDLSFLTCGIVSQWP